MKKTKSVLESTGDSKLMPELSSRLKNAQVSVIKEMMYLAAKEAKKGRSIVSLGVGIPYYKAPKHIHKHVIDKLNKKENIDKYTLLTGLPSLREIIANKSSKILKMKVAPDEILVTAGSMAALMNSFLALIDKKDEVIIPAPYFSSYGEQVSLTQGKLVPVKMKKTKKNRLIIDIKGVKNAINKRTKAIIINNPHNPTGAVFPKKNLLELSEIISKANIYLITDEVYDYLLFDNEKYFYISSLKYLWPKVIRCCSFSKKYGLMGWRIGYLHTNKNLVMNILKIHDASIVCAPHISQEAAIAALNGPQEVVNHHVNLLSTNRDIMLSYLNRLNSLFEYNIPKGAYYIFVKYKLRINSIEMAKKLLYETGVVTIPGIGFGQMGKRHLRLSFGAAPGDISEAMKRIENWWLRKTK